MNKIFVVDSTFSGMRLDRYLRNKLGKIPQSLIEKNLRNGKIKLNKRKAKSSIKLKEKDKINLFNLDFQQRKIEKQIKFSPSKITIKENEDLIIDNNDDFPLIQGINYYNASVTCNNCTFRNITSFKNKTPLFQHESCSSIFVKLMILSHTESSPPTTREL